MPLQRIFSSILDWASRSSCHMFSCVPVQGWTIKSGLEQIYQLNWTWSHSHAQCKRKRVSNGRPTEQQKWNFHLPLPGFIVVLNLLQETLKSWIWYAKTFPTSHWWNCSFLVLVCVRQVLTPDPHIVLISAGALKKKKEKKSLIYWETSVQQESSD